MSTSNLILLAMAIALLLGLLIWFVDYAAVHRLFGEVPSGYWRLRNDIRTAAAPFFYPPQLYATVGVAFVCLSMWAYAHPGHPFSWGPRGEMEVYWYPKDDTLGAKFSPANWNVRWARSGAKELIFARSIPYQHEKYGEQNHVESVSITARPYWAKHIWPRVFYRLEVGYINTDKIGHPDAGSKEEGKNPYLSYYHGVDAKIFFEIDGRTLGPIHAEQMVDSYHAVSYDRWAIRPLLEAMRATSQPINVRVEFWRDGKLLDTREFKTPGELEPVAVDVLLNKAQHMTTVFLNLDGE
jgi:hypothetical protein